MGMSTNTLPNLPACLIVLGWTLITLQPSASLYKGYPRGLPIRVSISTALKHLLNGPKPLNATIKIGSRNKVFIGIMQLQLSHKLGRGEHSSGIAQINQGTTRIYEEPPHVTPRLAYCLSHLFSLGF